MQPKILVNKNRDERESQIWELLKEFKITSSNPDLLLIEDDKLGIKEVKGIIKHLSTKPFGSTPKSVVILNGNNISNDAQNALLKTLEEPPEDSLILIGVDSEQKLLPTILSRCLIISYALPPTSYALDFNLDQILNMSIEERFDLIEKTDDKEAFLNNLTESYRTASLKGDAGGTFLEELLNAQIWKESNVNLRSILEYLMISLPNRKS